MEGIMSEKTEYLNSFDLTKIPTILNIPDTVNEPQECIVLLHGLTTSKNEYQDVYQNLATKLAERGRQSVRFDFRGHGDSEAKLDQFNVYNQIFDTLCVIKWIKSTIGVDKFIILGTSYAASAGIYSSYILEKDVPKLVLLAPILDFDRTFINPETEWGIETFGQSKVIETIFNNSLKVESGFNMTRKSALDMLLLDPRPILSALQCEISILHGTEDGMVPFAATKRFAEHNKHVSFYQMPQTGHGLAQLEDESRTSQRTIDNTNYLIQQLTGEEK